MRPFCRAGGSRPPDEERRAQLMKLLPSGTSMQNMTGMDVQSTAEDLIEGMRRKAIFTSEHGGRDGGAHVAEGQHPPPPPPVWTYTGNDLELQAFYNGEDGPRQEVRGALRGGRRQLERLRAAGLLVSKAAKDGAQGRARPKATGKSPSIRCL